MKILFFPSDSGGGFGHVSRCLALAQEARTRGHLCAFVLSNTKYEPKINPAFPVFIAGQQLPWSFGILGLLDKFIHAKGKPKPLYTRISGLAYQVVRDGLITNRSVKDILAMYRSIIKVFKPDLLVGDTNLLVWMLSRMVDLPVVQIVRYASHPMTAELIWWENSPSVMISPDPSRLFNPMLEKAGLEPISKAEDLLRGDFYLVPSIPEMEPIDGDGRTEFVGELLVAGNKYKAEPWSEWLNDSMPVIYVTIGGGASPVGNKMFFKTVIEAFDDGRAKIVVSTGGKYTADIPQSLAPNIQFFDWVSGRQMISRADLVIFHGGYATTMETIAAGKPTVIIPFHSEQEGNGRRLEQLGCGRVLKLSNDTFERVDAKWPFGEYNYLVQKRYDLKSTELKSTAYEILENSDYTVRAQALQKRVFEYGGAQGAMEFIEKTFGVRHYEG